MSQKIKNKISVRAAESKSKIEIEERPGKSKSKINHAKNEPENSKRKSRQSIDNGFGLCYNLRNKH